MILYTENSKDATRKLLECTGEFSKVEGYKINIPKCVIFLYTNSKVSGKEIKETIPFTITSKRIKYLGINLPKETKDLYSENYKMLLREIKEDINRWKDKPCSWIGRINIVKLQIQCNPYQVTNGIFHRTRTKSLKIVWRHRRPQIAKAILKKKNGARGMRLPDFRLY